MDIGILLWLQEHVRSDVLTPLFVFITGLGDIGFVWIAIGAVLVTKKRWRAAGILLWIALLSEWLLVDGVIKNIVMRERPFHANPLLLALIEEPDSFSFPSGHTGSSFAAAVVLWRSLPHKAALPFCLLAVLIAFSRLYVGVHYPTDVLAGAVIGICVGLICCRAQSAFFAWRAKKKAASETTGKSEAHL